jgi:hypothetical protein
MDRSGVAAVFWAQLEGAACLMEKSNVKINHDALQAYALAYLACAVEEVRFAVVDLTDRIDALKGV